MSFRSRPVSRRTAMRSLMGGSLLLPGILSQLAGTARGFESESHFPPKAKRVIFLYMSGGVSHVDSFDPKPTLHTRAGEKVPPGFVGEGKFLSRPRWDFRPGGKCGTEISDLFPCMRECADDLAVIRSMHCDHGNHAEAALQIHTGSFSFARPSIGSWVSYGLGLENKNLPSFLVLAPHFPYAGAQLWGNDFLPGAHQGVRVVPGGDPIPDMLGRQPRPDLADMERGLVQALNRKHLASRGGADPQLTARVKSFETAFGMQMEGPEAFDLSHESDATLALYGLERGQTKGFGWQCLVARRLAERGVRFIELIDTGAGGNWDAHGDMAEHEPLAKNVDRPIAGLLKDLKSRGLLDDTLVVWTTEFGRTPYIDSLGMKGREHHPKVFSSWLAGAGVRAGSVYGASDEFGISPASDGVHVHDFHATILHLLGFDHEKLIYRHGGRDYRLTDVAGHVVKGVLA